MFRKYYNLCTYWLYQQQQYALILNNALCGYYSFEADRLQIMGFGKKTPDIQYNNIMSQLSMRSTVSDWVGLKLSLSL